MGEENLEERKAGGSHRKIRSLGVSKKHMKGARRAHWASAWLAGDRCLRKYERRWFVGTRSKKGDEYCLEIRYGTWVTVFRTSSSSCPGKGIDCAEKFQRSDPGVEKEIKVFPGGGEEGNEKA